MYRLNGWKLASFEQSHHHHNHFNLSTHNDDSYKKSSFFSFTYINICFALQLNNALYSIGIVFAFSTSPKKQRRKQTVESNDRIQRKWIRRKKTDEEKHKITHMKRISIKVNIDFNFMEIFMWKEHFSFLFRSLFFHCFGLFN